MVRVLRGSREQMYSDDRIVGERIRCVVQVDPASLREKGLGGLANVSPVLQIRPGFRRSHTSYVIQPCGTEVHVEFTDEPCPLSFPPSDEPVVVKG